MAELHVEWSAAARVDLRAIVFHIAKDSFDNALAVADRIEARVGTLVTLSQRGRIVPELQRMGEHRYRELIEGPWRVIYLLEESSVRVVAVVDSRRNLGAWAVEKPAAAASPFWPAFPLIFVK